MNSELSMDQVFIEKLTNLLEVNLDKEHFGVKEFAKEAGLSRAKLHRKLQSITGKSSSKFICEYRLKKAMEMLQNDVATVSEIAYRVGFSSPTYFNTCFHDHYGYTPGEVKFRNPKTNEDNDDTASIETNGASQSQKTIEPTVVKKSLLTKRMVWINTFVIVLLSVFCYYLYSNYKDYFTAETLNTNSNEKSIGIIPFKNLSKLEEDKFFTLGVTASLQSQLNTIKGIKVICEKSMEKYADTIMAPSEIANELGVTYLLNGTVQKHKDSIRVIIHVINAKDDKQLKSIVFIEEFDHLLALQSNIAKQVALELNIKLSQVELEQIEKKPTENLEAYNLYIKGRFFWHKLSEEDLKKSIYYFDKALELDPTYALAYAGLSDSYFAMRYWRWIPSNEGFNKAKEFAQKALAIDNTIAEAHATLGGIAIWYEWNWKDAEKEIKQAINFKPNYATAHQYYAELLRILGRYKEAREQIDMALELNPNSYSMYHHSADYYKFMGQYEKAIIDANKAKEIDKDLYPIYFVFHNIYILQEKPNLAIAALEKAYSLKPPDIPYNMVGIRDAFDRSGILGVVRYKINYLIENNIAHKSPIQMALKYAILKESEKSLEWLEIAYDSRDLSMVNIKNIVHLNYLHNEPRYKAILKKMELPEQYE